MQLMCISFSTALHNICPDLSDPAHGVVLVDGESVGDNTIFTCDSGYELVGSSVLTCRSDGSWSDEPPVCRGISKYVWPVNSTDCINNKA